MRPVVVAWALAGGAAALGPVDARAQAPAPTTAHGALVVALGPDASAAAKALAREVYRDERLRPNVDDSAARVLAGEPAADDASESLRSLAKVRESLPTNPDDLGARLIAAIGQERQAEIVVAVSMSADRPIARVVRVASARYESVLFEATTARDDAGAVKYTWPDATTTLHKLFVVAPSPQATAPLAPRKVESAPPKPVREGSSWYKSPWFWGPLGAVVATGAAILIASQATKDDVDTVRLRGQVGP